MPTRILWPLLSALSALLAAAAVHAGDLTIDITIPDQRQGDVRAALFDKAEAFPRGTPLRTAIAPSVGGKATLRFDGLPPGDYALTAFLDENSNSKLDANLFGLPTDPYGFSRNARGMTGPPPFTDAAFRVEDGALQQNFVLQ
ncbi:MAG: DUF2141 domain-containing protein [Polaromonas sp.]|uniref:DUF2141 domain-containing protein n=1 Tax=Polaromonas sp. TaxID=1869339 RepID=UPI0040351AF2